MRVSERKQKRVRKTGRERERTREREKESESNFWGGGHFSIQGPLCQNGMTELVTCWPLLRN